MEGKRVSDVEILREGPVYVPPREKQLLRCFAQRKSNHEIAIQLGGSVAQVEAQRKRIMKKFDIKTQAQFVAIAEQFAAYPNRRRK